MSLLSLVTFIFIASSALASKCPTDTSTWCESIQTAKACNVLRQCQTNVWAPKSAMSNPVNLTLYYEVLCPDCRQFISQQVAKTFSSLSSIMNLVLVPYGNAKQTLNEKTKLWEFTCQHGVDECWGNTLHSCLIANRPKTEEHFPFVVCMESEKSRRYENMHDVAQACAKKLGMDISLELKCVDGVQGNELLHKMGMLTESLKPAHTYVPWVTLNGVHTEDIQTKAQDDLIKLICDTYSGDAKPQACN